MNSNIEGLEDWCKVRKMEFSNLHEKSIFRARVYAKMLLRFWKTISSLSLTVEIYPTDDNGVSLLASPTALAKEVKL